VRRRQSGKQMAIMTLALFGERDSWSGDPRMTFHTTVGLQQRFAGFSIESLTELENDRPTALGDPKHWHIFEVLARRA
jgi:tellurite methyltransferase